MQPCPVPVRTILVTIGLVIAAYIVLQLVIETRRVLVWAVIALFFAVALSPAVDALERRVARCHRSVATLLVFLVAVVAVAALVALFVTPLAQEGSRLAGRLPQMIEDARAGRGPVGDLLERTHALRYVQQHQQQIRGFATGLGTPALAFVRGAATTLAGAVTIFVLAYLMVLEGPKAVHAALTLVDEPRAARIRRVGAACARTVTGYLTGNLLISVICGVLTYVVLLVAGVPFAGLLALFVALADLIPLVGATLGAVVASVAALVHSLPAGIGAIVFFVVYQQVENHLLQPVILSRTVKLNPLTVLLAILIAVEVAGILGALLAIPVAGMIQVVLRDIWAHRDGRPFRLPMKGDDETQGAQNATDAK
ncbi:Predicted PurR-regulated permease PerM [Streptomyces sp. 1222.5]|uniref:AI-2E family transporter n=1 Tax=unclassified Streptomyces TaxID=2593676 RepID=UPI0008991C2D|nr:MULTISPECIES: AI-2E family transporter [unclassified Streptomyces]PKW05284.1 putative PurR-regulated permease PerM [Streptomyces sp. 5112.2]SED44712.1 Predicted PurR-regulated permease PerM [Streptomyces sp. 1222.5]